MSTPSPSVVPACPRCGAPNQAGLTQCPNCGQSLLVAWPPPPGSVYPPPAYHAGPDNTIGGLIPYKNSAALTAYYLGVFSLIPCVAIPLGIGALILGLRGLAYARQHPEAKGVTHAWIGIILGGLFGLINLVALIALLVSAGRHS